MEWEKEFKKHLLKELNLHFKEMYGEEADDITEDNIVMINIPLEHVVEELPSETLANIYVTSIMKEDFEEAEAAKKILIERGCDIDLQINEDTKKGILQISLPVTENSEKIEFHLKVLKDGLCIDFEKDGIL